MDWMPWSYTLTKQERDEQDAWLREQLAQPLETPFLIATAHHPLYSNGGHGDNPILIKE